MTRWPVGGVLAKLALWVKEYTHPLRVLGGLFFVLALVSGIIWMFGAQIEPLAFTAALVSSLLLASPSVAEYLVPDRKPISLMSFSEILDLLLETNPSADWHRIALTWSTQVFLKEDPRLRFHSTLKEEGIQNSDFQEQWANRHPDSKACGIWHDLYYDGCLIERFILVSVDGARAEIPPPDSNTGRITRLAYQVARINDVLNTVDEYIRRSGLEVDNAT